MILFKVTCDFSKLYDNIFTEKYRILSIISTKIKNIRKRYFSRLIAHGYNSSSEELRQKNFHEFDPSLSYSVSFRSAWLTG